MSKSFTHAGVSKLDGEFKVRFANDSTRVKVLIKNGHTEIDMLELKHPMTKEEAVAYLVSIDFATQNGVTNPEVKAALDEAQAKRSERKPAEKALAKTAKTAKAAKSTAKPTMESIKAKAAKAKAVEPAVEEEDAPF